MDTKQKDELRDRNRRRAYNCSKCGGTIDKVDGAKLDSASHFAGVIYRVCPCCGREEVQRTQKRRPRL
jgi:hypothetical protein